MKKVVLSVSMDVLLAGTLGLSSTRFSAKKFCGNWCILSMFGMKPREILFHLGILDDIND